MAVFPGSNCEHDVQHALGLAGAAAELVWHTDTDLAGFDAVVLPGGFAHGDYLRPGAIARFSPIMGAVSEMARAGRPVLGICNGFQILTEAGLLPGGLRRNAGMHFICAPTTLTVASSTSVITRGIPIGTRLRIPINHAQGNYGLPAGYSLPESQVVLRYEENPNGSLDSIAGVSNERGNVVALMPHPERACEAILGSQDGLVLLESFVASADDR